MYPFSCRYSNWDRGLVILTEGSKFRNLVQVFLLFLFLGLAVYYNSFSNQFLKDDYHFLQTPSLSKAKFLAYQWLPNKEQVLGVISPRADLPYYRPFSHILSSLCFSSFGNVFWKYHLLNLILWVAAIFVVYLFLWRITKNTTFALLASVFYLVHPINGIVVNYITAHIFSVQVAFMAGCMMCFWESIERGNHRAFYYAGLLLFVMSLFCHETSIMVPFYLAALVFFTKKLPYKSLFQALIPYFLILIAYMVFRMFFASFQDAIFNKALLFKMNIFEYILTIVKLFMWYVEKIFYPKGIVFIWETPIVREYIFAKMALLLAGLAGGIYFFCRANCAPIVRVAITWIILGFLPLGLMAFSHGKEGIIIEPHWFVFSSVGFFILFAHYVLALRGPIKEGYWKAVVAALILIWACFSHAYNYVWANEKTYAQYWSKQLPHFRSPKFDLGHAYYLEGNLEESKRFYLESLGGSLDEQTYNNLGNIEFAQGNYKEAEAYYKRCLEYDALHSGTYFNLGAVYLKYGQKDKAKECFIRSYTNNPYQKEALVQLIILAIEENNGADLNKYASLYLGLEDDPLILTSFGVVMAQKNFDDLAARSFEAVIRIHPNYSEAYLQAGRLMANKGQLEKAVYVWKLGLQIDPENKWLKDCLKQAAIDAENGSHKR